jgi:hypothetical protein
VRGQGHETENECGNGQLPVHRQSSASGNSIRARRGRSIESDRSSDHLEPPAS